MSLRRVVPRCGAANPLGSRASVRTTSVEVPGSGTSDSQERTGGTCCGASGVAATLRPRRKPTRPSGQPRADGVPLMNRLVVSIRRKRVWIPLAVFLAYTLFGFLVLPRHPSRPDRPGHPPEPEARGPSHTGAGESAAALAHAGGLRASGPGRNGVRGLRSDVLRRPADEPGALGAHVPQVRAGPAQGAHPAHARREDELRRPDPEGGRASRRGS